MPTFGGIVVSTGGSGSEDRRRLIDVVDELSRPVNAGSQTVRSIAADAFRSAVRKIGLKGNWPWEWQEEDVAIVANQVYSTISARVKKPLAMHLLDEAGGVRDQRIAFIEFDAFMEKYTLDVASEPHSYTIPNHFETRQVRWFPTPSSNDNARFTYYRVTPTPTAMQESIEIPEGPMEAYMSLAWLEFLKRIPSEQRPFPITIALSEWRATFRTLSAYVNRPGDATRQKYVGEAVV